jgi:hypothetical protein
MADQVLNIELILGVDEVTSHRIRKFGYGDGYEQIAPDGINTKVREYNITTVPFSASTASDFREVLDDICIGDFFKTTTEIGLPPYIPAGSDSVRFRLVDNKYTLKSLPASDKFQFMFAIREAFSG